MMITGISTEKIHAENNHVLHALSGGVSRDPEFEVVGGVVKPIPVFMVDGFSLSERPVYDLRHDINVLPDIALPICIWMSLVLFQKIGACRDYVASSFLTPKQFCGVSLLAASVPALVMLRAPSARPCFSVTACNRTDFCLFDIKRIPVSPKRIVMFTAQTFRIIRSRASLYLASVHRCSFQGKLFTGFIIAYFETIINNIGGAANAETSLIAGANKSAT